MYQFTTHDSGIVLLMELGWVVYSTEDSEQEWRVTGLPYDTAFITRVYTLCLLWSSVALTFTALIILDQLIYMLVLWQTS